MLKLLSISAILLVCLSTSARAVTVYNLSDNGDSIDVWDDAEGYYKPRTVVKGKSVYLPGQVVKIRYAGVEKILEGSTEYVIWNDGIFSVQQRKR